MPFTTFDHAMMSRALQLAARGRYSTHPNPCVGCVIAQGEVIVGEGWHQKAGEAHAEVHALQAAGDSARGAVAYVTLEPHSHQGRTPPCTGALIHAGVRRVVCAMSDPNPNVNGAGFVQLQNAGVLVETGLLATAARDLNRGFVKRMQHGIPWVTLKLAGSLDGRTALANGASRWITSEPARADVQRLRAAASAILTGIETVLADDPQLTVRDVSLDLKGRQPLRVVLDSRSRLPAQAQLLRAPGETLVISVGTYRMAVEERVTREVVDADNSGRVDLKMMLALLAGKYQCNEVLVEAGATLSGSFIQMGLVDELIVYLAPTVLGHQARPLLSLPLIERMHDRMLFKLKDTRVVGSDLKLVFEPQPVVHSD